MYDPSMPSVCRVNFQVYYENIRVVDMNVRCKLSCLGVGWFVVMIKSPMTAISGGKVVFWPCPPVLMAAVS